MSRYHLRARLVRGPLAAPERDETREEASDRLSELLALAGTLSEEGFTVWIFVHGLARLPGASDLVVQSRFEPRPRLRSAARRTLPPGPDPGTSGCRCAR